MDDRTAPPTTRTRWCRVGQHLGTGGGTANMVFPAEAVTTRGALGDFRRIAEDLLAFEGQASLPAPAR